MNARRLTPPLLIALAVSGVCTLALSRRISGPKVKPLAMVSYLAPTRVLAAGEVIKPENLQTIQWPASNAVPGAFVKSADIVGRAALYPLDANQPVTEKMVSAPGAGAGLASHIPQGMRAVALKSDEVMGVAGFLQPGSHLDVLVTYRTDQAPEPRTVTVLQNAEVLAAGQQVQPDPQGKPATVSVVTVLLTPEDAERVVLASAQGTIHFVLRSGLDQTQAKTGGVSLSQLADPAALPGSARGSAPGSAAGAAPAATAPARPSRPASPVVPKLVHQSTVETISGDKQVTATFSDGAR